MVSTSLVCPEQVFNEYAIDLSVFEVTAKYPIILTPIL